MARIRDAAWPNPSGDVRVSFPRWLLYRRAGNAVPMLSRKDLVVTQRSRAALHLDILAGGREFDSHRELVRATLPARLLTGADRSLVLLIICCCDPHKKLHRNCRDNTEQHLAQESAIALTRKPPIRGMRIPEYLNNWS